MTENSPLLVICVDQDSQLPVEELARSLDQKEPQVISGTMMEAGEALASRTTPPAWLVIDIGGRGHDILIELDNLARHCEATIRVVVTGKLNDVALYRELIKRGIIEYYAYPVNIQAMVEALKTDRPIATISTASAAPVTRDVGSCIGFVSAASGDGASTVALNTAYILAKEYNKNTVLVDLDYQYGMVARHLDLQASYGIRELIDYPDRGVDAALVQKMLVPYTDNLNIIAAPNELRYLPDVQPETILDLLDLLKSQFDYVILDIPHLWVSWLATLISRVDHRVLVSQLWLRSLTHVIRILAAWQEVDVDKNAVSLVVNRSGSRIKKAMTAQDFERVARTNIQFFLDNDTRAIVESENQGKPLVEIGESALQTQLTDLAATLHAKISGESVTLQQGYEQKKSLLGLFK